MRLARMFIPMLTIIAVTACTADKDPGGPEADELVGRWEGPITRTDAGFQDTAIVIFDLAADGEFTATIEDSAGFTPLSDGIWGVTGGVFIGAGLTLDGVEVNYTAPKTDDRLEGAWSAGFDINGEFDVIRQ